MIYLFEDREDRMKVHFKGDLGKYKDVIDVEHKVDSSIDELPEFISSLHNLEILILHKSYSFSDKSITPENIKVIIKRAGKKFVLFSGGIGNAIIDDDEIMMNSGDLYNNLDRFLRIYKEKKDANLNHLFFQSEMGYEKHQLNKFQNKVLMELIDGKNRIDKLRDEEKFTEIKKEYKNITNIIEEYLYADVFSDDRQKLIQLLERQVVVEMETLYNQIQKMIAKYEYV